MFCNDTKSIHCAVAKQIKAGIIDLKKLQQMSDVDARLQKYILHGGYRNLSCAMVIWFSLARIRYSS